MEEWYDLIFAGAGILVGAILITLACVFKKTKDGKGGAFEGNDTWKAAIVPPVPEDPDEVEEMPIEEKHVKVIQMQCGTHVKASDFYTKYDMKTQFLVTFEDDEGEVFDLFVGEETYLTLCEGKTLTLAFVDGKLFDYALDGEGEEG
jgi:hypothetical protein